MNFGVDLGVMIFAAHSRAHSMVQDCTQIGAKGAKAIAAAIQVNTTVERLYLVSYGMQS